MNDAIFIGFVTELADMSRYPVWECPACHTQYDSESEAEGCCPDQTKELMGLAGVSQRPAKQPAIAAPGKCVLDDGTLAFRWNGSGDVRGYVPPEGCTATAYLIEIHPETGEQLEESEWWIFQRPRNKVT